MKGTDVKIVLPDPVRTIIDTLTDAGFEAFAVGGCIRDSIMGREPKDWDITTSALPSDVKGLFRHTVDTGIKHGTVTVLLNGTGYEVTTYRIDGYYSDGRHPDEVIYTKLLHEDLLRRDFCMNAMAYNDRNGLEDPFCGLGDIENREIGCVGNAHERFTEDALRILRAVRFAAELGFSIRPETKKAAGELSGRLSLISAERIHAELDKILMSPDPGMIATACELGIMKVILPEFRLTDDFPLYAQAIRAADDLRIKWSLFLASFGVKSPKTLLKRMKFDNDTIHDCVLILSHTEYSEKDLDKAEARKYLHEVGGRAESKKTETAAKLIAEYVLKDSKKQELIEKISEVRDEIIRAGDCLFIKDLTIDGRELIELGIEQGNKLGEILNQLLIKVLEQPELNTREQLKALASAMK